MHQGATWGYLELRALGYTLGYIPSARLRGPARAQHAASGQLQAYNQGTILSVPCLATRPCSLSLQKSMSHVKQPHPLPW